MKLRGNTVPDWLVGVIIVVLSFIVFVTQWGPFAAIEFRTYDLRQKLRQKKVESPVVIVAIDDESIKNIGRWPWPRAYMADAVDLLSKYGAKVIGINVLYTEEDRNAGLPEIRAIRSAIETLPGFEKNDQIRSIHEAVRQFESRLDNDTKLAASIHASGRVVLPLYFTLGQPAGRAEGDLPPYLIANGADAPLTLRYLSAIEAAPPVHNFATVAAALGHSNLIQDSDGAVRREALVVRYREKVFPSFALQLALRYLNARSSDMVIAYGVTVGERHIPTDDRKLMLINYNGKYNSFPYYSFFDVLTNVTPPEVFRDKIVLIGHTGTGIAPLNITPVQNAFPTVEIQANVIENILSGNFNARPTWALFVDIGVMVIFGAVITLLLPKLKTDAATIVTVALLFLWNGAAVFLFIAGGYWLSMFCPSFLAVAGFGTLMAKRFLLAEKRHELADAESIESSKLLGLSFQGQGMLDLAFEKFRKCPVEDGSVKDLLYNLALDFERKRMFNKAIAVYEHIGTVGEFKDIRERIRKLKIAEDTMIFGIAAAKKDTSVLVEGATTKPTLGRYEIVRELGRGAMGTVYLGRDPKINRTVAIKTIRFDEIEADQLKEAKERFFREAEAAGRLSHPNIVTIFDAGEDYEVAYVAMELLEGDDLTVICKKDHLLPVKDVLAIVSSIAEALRYAHQYGVVHRDIKPANIMLLKNHEVKVTDFGIARVMASSKTQTGVVLGTPGYMSPEQVVGKKVDGRSDLFSLGVVMFELLTGTRPFRGESIASLMYNIANKPPQPIKSLRPDIPDCCAFIVFKLLIKDVEKRYQNASEVVHDIMLCLKQLG